LGGCEKNFAKTGNFNLQKTDIVKNNVSKVKENVNEGISKSIDKFKNLF
jgi:hypothetical protein